jgi:hypothetical protein
VRRLGCGIDRTVKDRLDVTIVVGDLFDVRLVHLLVLLGLLGELRIVSCR